MVGPLWRRMHAQPRQSAGGLRRRDLPRKPGVYAWYRDGNAIYVGKAASLKDRLGRHLGRGRVMVSSAFRRNVAEHLGISTALRIKRCIDQPDVDELAAVRRYIEGCEAAWITTVSEETAAQLERDMKREWLPPLTRK